MSTAVAVRINRSARLGTRLVGSFILLGLAGGAEAVAFTAQNQTDLPLVQTVGLLIAAVWAVAGVAVWDGTWIPLPAVGSILGASGIAAARLSGSEHRLGSAVATAAGCLFMAVWFHWLLALPGARIQPARRWRITSVACAYGAAVVAAASLASTDRSLGAPVVAGGLTVLSLVAIPSINQSYVDGTSHDRDVLRWLAAGAAIAGDLAVIICVLHALIGWPRPLGAAAAASSAVMSLGLVAGNSQRVAALGGRVLVNILSVTGFTLVMSLIYLIVVLGLGRAPEGADRETLGLSMIAASIGAVAYVPARERLMQSATRMVYGTRQAPDEMVRTFGSRLTRAIPMDELLLQLAESLTRTMGLSSASVYTGSGDILERAASVPEAGPAPRSIVVSERERPVVTRAGVSGNAWISVWLPALIDGEGDSLLRVAPIRNAGELLGLLVVAKAATADPFSEDDDRILADLAREVGLAFHNTQLDAALQTTLAELRAQAVELRESRARLVASGDAERRKVERNLHDGAQQNLVALAVSMRLARDMVGGEPEALTEMLEAMQSEVQRTIQELRDLAHGIYPPLLVDGGLTPALSAAASRSPLDVVVESSEARYPGEIEAAVYFCCLEALQNAGKHAPDAHVEIRLWEESGGLLFTVTDDGPGFDRQAVGRGQGFTNMSDRLGAIGGSVRWESEPGRGARVSGSVPLP